MDKNEKHAFKEVDLFCPGCLTRPIWMSVEKLTDTPKFLCLNCNITEEIWKLVGIEELRNIKRTELIDKIINGI